MNHTWRTCCLRIWIASSRAFLWFLWFLCFRNNFDHFILSKKIYSDTFKVTLGPLRVTRTSRMTNGKVYTSNLFLIAYFWNKIMVPGRFGIWKIIWVILRVVKWSTFMVVNSHLNLIYPNVYTRIHILLNRLTSSRLQNHQKNFKKSSGTYNNPSKTSK